jgi:hypothetical protein
MIYSIRLKSSHLFVQCSMDFALNSGTKYEFFEKMSDWDTMNRSSNPDHLRRLYTHSMMRPLILLRLRCILCSFKRIWGYLPESTKSHLYVILMAGAAAAPFRFLNIRKVPIIGERHFPFRQTPGAVTKKNQSIGFVFVAQPPPAVICIGGDFCQLIIVLQAPSRRKTNPKNRKK